MRMLKTSLAQVNELKGELKESVDQIEGKFIFIYFGATQQLNIHEIILQNWNE